MRFARWTTRLPRIRDLGVGVGVTLLCMVVPAFLPTHWGAGVELVSSSWPAGRMIVRSASLLETRYVVTHAAIGVPPPFPEPGRLFREAVAQRYEHSLPMIDPAPNTQFALWTATSRGFPFRCAWGWESELNGSPTGSGGWLGEPSRGAPVRPMWLGLLLDLSIWTLLAAYAPSLARTAARFYVGAYRARRGFCPACGYDRRGLAADAKCPECGK